MTREATIELTIGAVAKIARCPRDDVDAAMRKESLAVLARPRGPQSHKLDRGNRMAERSQHKGTQPTMSQHHIIDSPIEDEVFDVVIGVRVGAKTAAALAHGQMMTPERLQAAIESFRRGEPVTVADRTPSKAELLQRANAAFRK